MKRLGSLIVILMILFSIPLSYGVGPTLVNDANSLDDANFVNAVGNAHNANSVIVQIPGQGQFNGTSLLVPNGTVVTVSNETTLQRAINRGLINTQWKPVGYRNDTIYYMGSVNPGNVFVGIGTPNPMARLDVNGGIRVGWAPDDVCAPQFKGTIRYNYTSNSIQYCNSTVWTSLSSALGSLVPPPIVNLSDTNVVRIENYVDTVGLCFNGDCRNAWNQISGGSGQAGNSNLTGTITAGYILRAYNDSGIVNSALYQDANNNIGVGSDQTVVNAKLAVSGNFSTTTGAFLATTSGNVGVGTANPTSKLHVVGSAFFPFPGNEVITLGTNTVSHAILNAPESFYVNIDSDSTATSNVFQVAGNRAAATGGNAYFTILDNGNVGVGSVSPVAKLQSTGAAQVTAPTLGSPNGGALLLTNTDNLYGTLFGVASNGNSWIQSQRVDATATAYHLVLQPSGGYVGIGGTPSYPLEVQNSADAQLRLISPDVWAGINFADASASDTIWYRGSTSTFAIGGGGSVVANKKLHVDGGVTIGANYDATAIAANSLNVEGSILRAGNTVWDAGNDGSGSGLDADTLDTLSSASFARTDANSAIAGNNYITFGPNAGWSAYLRVGGNGYTSGQANNYASVVTTDGNLHLDAGGSKTIYLNYYSGTSGIQFCNGLGNGGCSARFSSAGVLTAPSLYDNDNGAYYVDPASTSTMNIVNSINNNILGGTSNSANDATLYVSATNNNDWGLIVDKYTGGSTEYGADIRVGSAASYAFRIMGNGAEVFRVNGVGALSMGTTSSRLYLRDDDESTGGAKSVHANSNVIGFLNGAGSWLGYWDNSGNQINTGSVRGPLFYDTDNLAYYVDPASTSITNDMRANIFYDQGNTGYYLDPAGTSQLSLVYANNWFRPQGRTGLYSPDYGSHFYFHGTNYMRLSNDNGIVFGSSNTFDSAISGYVYHDGTGFGLLSSDGNWRVRTVAGYQELYGVTYEDDTRSNIYYDRGNTGFYLDPASTSILNDIRPSIMYDRDNTGYYSDPASTSNLNNLRVIGVDCINTYCPTNGAIRSTPNLHFNTPAGYALIVNWDNGAVAGSTQQFRVGNGAGTDQFYVRADGGFMGRLFYDLDNTGYYVDPASTSNTNAMRAASYVYTSDARLKKNVAELKTEESLKQILALKPVSFEWTNNSELNGTHLGLIAQDVEKVLPQTVVTGDDGYKSVEYGNLVAPLIAAMQEQQKQIEALTARIAELEAQN